MDTLLFSLSVNSAADSVGERFLQVRTWKKEQSQAWYLNENSIVYKKKKNSLAFPCLYQD